MSVAPWISQTAKAVAIALGGFASAALAGLARSRLSIPTSAVAPPAAGPTLCEAEEEIAMSWFTKDVENPLLKVFTDLISRPSIQNSPAAVADVTDAQTQAVAAAGIVASTATTVAEAVTTAAAPVVQDMAKGIQDVLDAALVAELGPIGTVLTPAANDIVGDLEAKVGTITAALFAHIKGLVPSGQATAESVEVKA